jgi:hypothetical protein
MTTSVTVSTTRSTGEYDCVNNANDYVLRDNTSEHDYDIDYEYSRYDFYNYDFYDYNFYDYVYMYRFDLIATT